MRLLWAGLAIQLLGSAPVLVTGGGTKFTKPQVRLTTTFADFNARIMDHWEAEEGGGSRYQRIPIILLRPDTLEAQRGMRYGGRGHLGAVTLTVSAIKRLLPDGRFHSVSRPYTGIRTLWT
ncbi:hypothetical protein FRC19_005650 [Serendipita sp. 401]|nr:hypothetical protein FRC15_007170 [Serendipita sp. 397]KAG8766070.1 hypothetical protein FRC16_007783 [Serendipita sp. 398]KAG8808821.1 hypothetical protein FRC19_005650 [Serendipita sp. 401]KAG9020259.1 hypothetical protein FS842_007446 [Serendipita sp. 407]